MTNGGAEMTTISITFNCVEQVSQQISGSDDHMIGKVYFSINLKDRVINSNSAIKQEAGSNFRNGAIEVGRPEGYKGAFNHGEFSREVEKYFKSIIGQAGSIVRLGQGATFVGSNNRFSKSETISLNVDDNFAAGW
jgi:hypothetical protein